MYKSEDRILLERDKMSENVESLRRETENIRDENTKLVEEKQKQNVVIEKLNQENLRNFGALVNTIKHTGFVYPVSAQIVFLRKF